MVLKEGSNLPLVVNYIMCRVFQADSFNVEMFSRYPFGAKTVIKSTLNPLLAPGPRLVTSQVHQYLFVAKGLSIMRIAKSENAYREGT